MNWLLRISSVLFLVVTVTMFQSCWLGNKDLINIQCDTDCITIQGKFTTDDGNIPVNDAWLELNWRNIFGPGFFVGGQRRRIATSRTDENGNFTISFYAKDDELVDGFFALDYKVPDDSYFNTSTSSFRMHGINKRDTLIAASFNIPKRGAKILLRIKNRGDIKNGESLLCYINFNFGDRKFYNLQAVGQLDSKIDSESTFETAANQLTYLLFAKKKDGQYSEMRDSVLISPNETKVYEVEF